MRARIPGPQRLNIKTQTYPYEVLEPEFGG